MSQSNTQKEQQVLIATHDASIRCYKIEFWGWSNEGAYLELTKNQYEFWQETERKDAIIEYIEDSIDEGKPEWVPDEMDFMRFNRDDGTFFYCEWDSAPTEFFHQWGCTVDEISSIYVTEVDSLHNEITKPINYDFYGNLASECEVVNSGEAVSDDDFPDYILNIYSSSKGFLFEGIIKSNSSFDIKNFKFYTQKYPDGSDIIKKVEYDMIEIEQMSDDNAYDNVRNLDINMWSRA